MEDWLHPALRFAHYALLLGLFGLTAFRVTGLRRIAWTSPHLRMPRGVMAAAFLAPFVSLALLLVGIAAMLGQPVSQLEWITVQAMALDTSHGWAFLARLALLIAAALLVLRTAKPLAWRSAALLYACAVSTLPWSGHAAATEGALGLFHRLNDVLHLLAAGLWIGAIGWFICLVGAAHRAPEQGATTSLLAVMRAFAPFGMVLVVIVAITGLVNTGMVVGFSELREAAMTSYGLILLVKVAVFGLMLLCAIRNAILSRHGESSSEVMSGEMALRALRVSLATEMGLGVVVVGLVAMLGLLSPMT